MLHFCIESMEHCRIRLKNRVYEIPQRSRPFFKLSARNTPAVKSPLYGKTLALNHGNKVGMSLFVSMIWFSRVFCCRLCCYGSAQAFSRKGVTLPRAWFAQKATKMTKIAAEFRTLCSSDASCSVPFNLYKTKTCALSKKVSKNRPKILVQMAATWAGILIWMV